MSVLNDLRSKGEELILSNGLTMVIKPMTIDTEAIIGELYDKGESMKAITVMIKTAIKSCFPDATDEEINDINKTDLKLITEKVLEVNGLQSDNKKKA